MTEQDRLYMTEQDNRTDGIAPSVCISHYTYKLGG